MCWGDVGLTLSMPRQGLGNSAIASVADDEQLKRFEGKWAAMAITEPEAGSDSAAIRTTAVLDEETGEYVLNGEKIFVTAGERADLVVVWASLDRDAGPRRDQVVRRRALEPRADPRPARAQARDQGPRTPPTSSSRTAGSRRRTCWARPRSTRRSRSPARCRPSTTRARWSPAWPSASPAPASSARRSSLAEAGVEVDYDTPAQSQTAAAAELLELEADWEAAHLLTLQASWMADNSKPNSLQASYAKAKAGRAVRRHRAALRRPLRQRRLRRGRAAREVGARRQDPRHLRGHPADPAPDHRQAAAGQDFGSSEAERSRARG